jgi:hypothetical protein
MGAYAERERPAKSGQRYTYDELLLILSEARTHENAEKFGALFKHGRPATKMVYKRAMGKLPASKLILRARRQLEGWSYAGI